jgi:hypothetical protein
VTGPLDVIVRRMLANDAELQERAAEASLQGGVCGFVTIHNDLMTRSFVHHRVPYGHQFTFPSLTAYDRWVENGYPS